jgi:hypothetical protein
MSSVWEGTFQSLTVENTISIAVLEADGEQLTSDSHSGNVKSKIHYPVFRYIKKSKFFSFATC